MLNEAEMQICKKNHNCMLDCRLTKFPKNTKPPKKKSNLHMDNIPPAQIAPHICVLFIFLFQKENVKKGTWMMSLQLAISLASSLKVGDRF